MRRAAKIDRNQPAIVKALRQAGASVQPLHMVGQGCPDLLCGISGKTFLLEVKDSGQPPSKQRLTADEFKWHILWRGQVAVVTSPEEALKVIGA